MVSPSPTPVPLSQLTDEWGWTIESKAAYEWAVERLNALGVSGVVGDIGSGSGEGAKIIRAAGYDIVAVDNQPALIVDLKADGFNTLEMGYNRQKVRGQGWAAVVMVSMLGYYEKSRRLIDAAMHDAPLILATVAPDSPVDTKWMKPQPTITPGIPWSFMEWNRAVT